MNALRAAVLASLLAGPLSAQDYAKATSGTRLLESGNGLQIKVLVEPANLGGAEVELGEITLPVGYDAASRAHRHQSIELLYILSGSLDHIVNDTTWHLSPGMVGMVRPGDRVVHRVVGDQPVRALVVWAPGGEVARLAPLFRQRVIPPSGQGGAGGP